jgi:hypothetical protein
MFSLFFYSYTLLSDSLSHSLGRVFAVKQRLWGCRQYLHRGQLSTTVSVLSGRLEVT